MPTVCRYRPNRSKKKFFSPCDVARIARNCVEDNSLRPEEVLACIAKGLGFTHVSLSRQEQVVESGISLTKGQISLAKKALSAILDFVKRRAPSLGPAIGAVLDILDKIDRVLDRILGPESEKVEDVIPKGQCECKQGEVEKWQARLKRGGKFAN